MTKVEQSPALPETSSDLPIERNALAEVVKSLMYFITHYPRRTVTASLASLALVSVEMLGGATLLPVLSLMIGENVDNPLIEFMRSNFEALGLTFDFNTAFMVFIIVYVTKALMEMFFGVYIYYSQVAVERDFRSKIIQGLNDVSWDYFTRTSNGLIVNAMTQEITRAASLFSSTLKVTVSGMQAAVYLMLGLAVSLELLIAAAVIGGIGLLVARPMFQMARRAGAGEIENLRDIASELLQGIQAIKVFKAMARESQLLATITSANDHFVEASKLKVRAQHFLTASQHIVLAGGVMVGVYVGRDIFNIGLAEIGFIAIILMRTSGNLTAFLKKSQAISYMYYALHQFDEFYREIADNSEIIDGWKTPALPSVIRFENVNFGYNRGSIIRDVNLEIPAVGLTTIIGPSGSGKTTIVDLLCGFYTPDKGNIYIGADPFYEIDLRAWRRVIGYVTQDANLLNQSIGFNVAAFEKDLDNESIAAALKAAGAWKFVSELNHGLDTFAGERGGQLSGGERQRIAIARALARQPKFLILDEPTAAIDSTTEREIVQTIIDLSKTIPILAISHQPILADAADVLYEMAGGRVERLR